MVYSNAKAHRGCRLAQPLSSLFIGGLSCFDAFYLRDDATIFERAEAKRHNDLAFAVLYVYDMASFQTVDKSDAAQKKRTEDNADHPHTAK